MARMGVDHTGDLGIEAARGGIDACMQGQGLAGPITVDQLMLCVQVGQFLWLQIPQACIGGCDEVAATWQQTMLPAVPHSHTVVRAGWRPRAADGFANRLQRHRALRASQRQTPGS